MMIEKHANSNAYIMKRNKKAKFIGLAFYCEQIFTVFKSIKPNVAQNWTFKRLISAIEASEYIMNE